MTGAECTCCCYTFKALGKFWWAKFKGQTERPTRPTDLAFVFPFGSPVKLIDFRKPAITGPQGQWGPQVCRYIDAKCWEHNRLRDSLMRLKFYRVVWADQPSFYPWAAQHTNLQMYLHIAYPACQMVNAKCLVLYFCKTGRPRADWGGNASGFNLR